MGGGGRVQDTVKVCTAHTVNPEGKYIESRRRLMGDIGKIVLRILSGSLMEDRSLYLGADEFFIRFSAKV